MSDPKICVSIGRRRHKMVVLEHRALAEKGAKFVELRIDWLDRPPDLSRLIKDRPTPCIVTCRRRIDRGHWKWTEEQRMMLLREAIVSGVEYVDLEDDVAGSVRRYGKTKRIVSHHNFEETPDNLEEIHARMRKLDPDVIKIVTMANSPRDMIRMLRLVANSDFPTVGFCMGELGIPSRILCGKFGAPFTYASFSRDRVMAPGQVSFHEMKSIYRFEEINRDTQVFGVIGDPIAHSYSPLVHNAAFRQQGLNCVYVPFRIPKDGLTESLKELDWLDMRGLSVTIPHKEAALEIAKEPDEISQAIGAANTLFRDENGVWHATNTDYTAAIDSLKATLQVDGETSATLSGKRALLLGAGGVARAIGLALAREGVAVVVTNRTHDRALELAEELGCQQTQWENRGSGFYDIVINCTSVGMHPNVDETPFPQHWFHDGTTAFDTIYNPENTLFLKQAKLRSCHVVSGVEMFVRQAASQFEIFTGRPATLDAMRESLRKGISAVSTHE